MKLTPEALLDLLARCHLPRPAGLCLIGLRGATADGAELTLNTNPNNAYNDTLIALDCGAASVIRYHHDYTSGEPGRYWVEHNTYAGPESGAPFTLCCGDIHLVRGQHRGQGRALVQADGIDGAYPALRDVDQDYRLESSDLFCFTTRANGINLHWGNWSEAVEAHSSGCHVVQSPQSGQPWLTFVNLLWNTYKAQPWFSYQVLEASWLDDRQERLLYGSRGKAVQDWQRGLNSQGYYCKIDGVFGQLTHNRTIQRNRDLKSTTSPAAWGIAWHTPAREDKPPAEPVRAPLVGAPPPTRIAQVTINGDSIIGRQANLPYTLLDDQAMIKLRDLEQLGATIDTTNYPTIKVSL